MEVKIKTFWEMPHFKEGQHRSTYMEEWTVPADIKLIGARIILLCDTHLQKNLDLYGAVTRNPNEKYDHIELKTDHLFYGQRDAYQYCAGMPDLVILDYLPHPYHFKIKKGEKLYFKGLANKAPPDAGNWDVLIDLLYVEDE